MVLTVFLGFRLLLPCLPLTVASGAYVLPLDISFIYTLHRSLIKSKQSVSTIFINAILFSNFLSYAA